MIRPEHIPDEVVEAALKKRGLMREAIADALNAWPDSEIHNFDGTHFAEAIVLPLPEAPEGRMERSNND